MNGRDYFVELYAYNAWANQRVLAAAAALSPEQRHQSHGHSWDSVHGVLVHVLSAEWIWLRRWLGESPRHLLNPQDFTPLAKLQAAWADQNDEVQAFVQAQTEASLERVVEYRSTKGEPFQNVLWHLLAHVINHSTHHRGELAAMMAALAAPHPEDDLVFYFRERSATKKG
jgi:uncharacterized damage-inducible protein DinB